MAFSDAFARGYAIGDAAKKRKATAKFFERFKEMTAEPADKDLPVTEIGGIPVPTDAAPAPEALPVTPQATGGETFDSAAPIPKEGGKARAYSPGEAIPISAPDTGEVAVEAPRAIPIGKKQQELIKSLNPNNIKELDRLALEAAQASGDVEVYGALRKTTDSFLQAKVLNNLSLAQAAADNGDTDAVEKFLKKAYFYVPDGQEISFQRDRHGTLMIKNPWADVEGQPKMVEMTADRIGMLATQLADPAKFGELVRQGRKDLVAEKNEQRRLAQGDEQLVLDRDRLGQYADQIEIAKEELGIKKAMAPIERLSGYNQAMYYKALSEKMRDGGAGSNLLDEADRTSAGVEKSMNAYFTAPTNDLGNPIAGWKMPDDAFITDRTSPEGRRPLNTSEIQGAKAFAQTIAIHNLGTVAHGVAAAAGLQLIKTQLDPEHFNAYIDQATGVMNVPVQGLNIPVRLPPAIVQDIIARQQQATQKPAGAYWNLDFTKPPSPSGR